MSHSRTSELTQPSRPMDIKTLRLLYIPASAFCIGLPLYLLFGFDPPRSGLVACLLPGLIGTVVGAYFGYRSLADVIEDGGMRGGCSGSAHSRLAVRSPMQAGAFGSMPVLRWSQAGSPRDSSWPSMATRVNER